MSIMSCFHFMAYFVLKSSLKMSTNFNNSLNIRIVCYKVNQKLHKILSSYNNVLTRKIVHLTCGLTFISSPICSRIVVISGTAGWFDVVKSTGCSNFCLCIYLT